MNTIPGRRIIISVFLVFLLLPIYWLVNMSFIPARRSIGQRTGPVRTGHGSNDDHLLVGT